MEKIGFNIINLTVEQANVVIMVIFKEAAKINHNLSSKKIDSLRKVKLLKKLGITNNNKDQVNTIKYQ